MERSQHDRWYIYYLLNLRKDTVITVSPETNFDCTIATGSDVDIVLGTTCHRTVTHEQLINEFL